MNIFKLHKAGWNMIGENSKGFAISILVGGCLLFGNVSYSSPYSTASTDIQVSSIAFDRAPSSLRFPVVNSVFDTEDMLEKYEIYLKFVAEIGKDVDRNSTQKLLKLYQQLRRKNPDQAAVFLKGLRFEMVSKVDLMGVSESELSTRTPELRRWVGRYMKEWVREADEHLFRSFTNQSLARKQP